MGHGKESWQLRARGLVGLVAPLVSAAIAARGRMPRLDSGRGRCGAHAPERRCPSLTPWTVMSGYRRTARMGSCCRCTRSPASSEDTVHELRLELAELCAAPPADTPYLVRLRVGDRRQV